MKTRIYITDAASYGSATTAHTCPLCADGNLIRIRRRAIDRLLSLFGLVYRYRCPNFSCQWEGNLRVRSHAVTTTIIPSR